MQAGCCGKTIIKLFIAEYMKWRVIIWVAFQVECQSIQDGTSAFWRFAEIIFFEILPRLLQQNLSRNNKGCYSRLLPPEQADWRLYIGWSVLIAGNLFHLLLCGFRPRVVTRDD